MHKSPLFVGVAASAGTFLAMGATTLVVSSVTLSVAKRVIKQRKVWSSTCRKRECAQTASASLERRTVLAPPNSRPFAPPRRSSSPPCPALPAPAPDTSAATSARVGGSCCPLRLVLCCTVCMRSAASLCLYTRSLQAPMLPVSPWVAGRAVVRSRAPVPLKALVSKAGQPPVPPVLAACPGCGTTLQQRCLNCLGEGRVCLPS